MKKIAILQFPGLNSERETIRAVNDAGMEGVLFRWNESPMELAKFDGFIIPGGFSYEDRGRAGLIASLDPIMDIVRSEVAKGKPLLGICNGAQVVVETCMVPGSGKLELCLANNKRIKGGEVVGTGFINMDVNLKAVAKPGRCAFNIDMEKDTLHSAPIAHGEGRFTTTNLQALKEIEENDQIIFKYCDEQGNIEDNYPTNPNGAFKNAAAICNLAGNVMAIMPHPERALSAPIPEIFTSMRLYLEEYFDKGKAMIPTHGATQSAKLAVRSKDALRTDSLPATLPSFEHKNAYFEIFVDLKITDNTAETFTNTLSLMGFEVEVRRQTHYTVSFDQKTLTSVERLLETAKTLIKSGELLNTNKEAASLRIDGEYFKYYPDSEDFKEYAHVDSGNAKFYVRDREDFVGQSKTEKILKNLKVPGFKFVVEGTLWTVEPTDRTVLGNVDDKSDKEKYIDKILQTNIFANPHSQDLTQYA